ncbi:MAG: XrtA-associated ATPase [Pseudomonadales bacterium]|nr:XrtA-associated ATPase [Pseudomonadales bacterium]
MYREYFNLSGKPFQLSPDARFFFPSKEHKRALSFLQYGLSQADGFIVVTGDVGTGKSTLVQALLSDVDADTMHVANLVTTQLGADDTLSLVAMNFGLKVQTESKAHILRDLEQLFVRIKREGKRPLLIVDEAQNLPPKSVEELRMLSNFQYQGKPLLQIFLLGQEEFRDTLLSDGFEQLRQRVIATYHLNPLSEDETLTYIEHRLGRVGWKDNPRIESEAFAEIFHYTDGVPRRINNLCDRLLLFCYLEEQHHISGQTVRTVAEEIGAEFLSGARNTREEGEGFVQPVQALHEPIAPTLEVRAAAPASASRAAPIPAPIPGANAEENTNSVPAEQPSQPLETMARSLFDKANVQQRLSSMERALDTMGHDLKEEMDEIKGLLEKVLEAIHRSDNRVKPNPERSSRSQHSSVRQVNERNRIS